MDGTIMAGNEGARVRLAVRAGSHRGVTSGIAPGYVQGNLAILPAADAGDFMRFCHANPKPCPLLAVSEPGDPMLPSLGDVDIRTDVPRYRLWRDGEMTGEVDDLHEVWRDDLVAFVLGCSFSFEDALAEAGLELRHIACGGPGAHVPVFRTSIACTPAGRFSGPLVVSMRPFRAADAIRAIQITSRFPGVHGAPVHLGDPSLIGIADVQRPDYGDPVPMAADDLPVFWACGVTPQAVAVAAKVPFMITHAPGHMLVTDLRNTSLAIL